MSETINLSKIKREKLLSKIEMLKEKINDEDMIATLNEVETELTKKKYGLVWEEHSEKVDEMMKDNIPVFVEDKTKEIVSDESFPFNFLLEGDNLHSLKLLEKTHKGEIGCIYIDPPYNRGKTDFKYNDNYIMLDDGYRHSKWLSFMEKRLRVARNLLCDDGLIFISIDDYEFSQLKLLCDTIFGEDKFINMFIWQRNSSGKTEKDKFTVNTEYVLLYAKSKMYNLNESYKPLSDGTKAMYSKNDNDGRGNYRLYPLQKPGNPGPETTYDYVDNSGKIWKCPAKGWRIKQSKLKSLENDGRLYLKGKVLSEKAYWNERTSEGKRIDTLWNDLPENSSASNDLDLILGEKGSFNNPKPVKLIKRCIEISPKNCVVLDFFAGSGTTAQAVLELNKEDGGNRSYILCTNNENNICEDITYQRCKTIITGKREDGSIYSDGLLSNLKYYKTDFVPKTNDGKVCNKLLDSIGELIKLEHHCDIDNRIIRIAFNDDEIDSVLKEDLSECKKLFISSEVFLTSEQEKQLSSYEVEVIDIPDYYFAEELREVDEL